MVIKVESLLDAQVAEVWDAITIAGKMRMWYFPQIPAFEPAVGFATRFTIENDGRKFTHLWEVTKVDPPREIHYKWSYAEYPGMGSVSFRLTPQGDKTQLTLISRGLETFPRGIP
ncbi:MAG: SRPBCC domain-containing protein [Bacteroidales bacterium]|nr:SRPBCC domain-containing protein [Bacteroidales bacterium]MDT8432830.1 SRPBCC domain-containing protein [Bacteroidales bacterium]